MLKAVKFAARGESASILGNRTGFSCNAPGKKLQHTNACSARVEQRLVSWRAVAMRRRRFLFQLMDLLTERRFVEAAIGVPAHASFIESTAVLVGLKVRSNALSSRD